MLLLALVLLLLITLIIYFYFVNVHKHWIKRGVPQKDVVPIFGNVASGVFRKRANAEVIKHLYDLFPGKRYGSNYNKKEKFCKFKIKYISDMLASIK